MIDKILSSDAFSEFVSMASFALSSGILTGIWVIASKTSKWEQILVMMQSKMEEQSHDIKDIREKFMRKEVSEEKFRSIDDKFNSINHRLDSLDERIILIGN